MIYDAVQHAFVGSVALESEAREVCRMHGLELLPKDTTQGRWEVTLGGSLSALGGTEVQALQSFVDGITTLIRFEKVLLLSCT